MSSTRQRPVGRRGNGRPYYLAAGLVGSLTAAFGGLVLLPGTASAESVKVTYAKISDWGGGYTAQYTLTNSGTQAVHGWHLAFDLPAGAEVSSLWNGVFSV